MNYPIIDPEIVSLGFVSIRWYGVMYLVGFLLCYLLGGYRARIPKSGWTKEEVYDMVSMGSLELLREDGLASLFSTVSIV